MITTYMNGRIVRNSMKDAHNGIYIGHYTDMLGVKIGETEHDFTARWGQISSTSETGFRGLYYYIVGDYGKNTSVVREVLEIIVRRRVSIYAAQHKKFYNFQGDSFICSVEACEKFIDFIMENCSKWDKYFEKKEKEIVDIISDMLVTGKTFETYAMKKAYILMVLDDCMEEE